MATCIHCPNVSGEYLMTSAHLHNVPALHYAFKIQLLCNKVYLQGCYEVVSPGGNSFKSKVIARLWTGSSNLVTTLCNNLVTRLPHPCHKLGISVWVNQSNVVNFYGYLLGVIN